MRQMEIQERNQPGSQLVHISAILAMAEMGKNRMIYFGVAAILFIGDLFIKNYMDKALEEGVEKSRLNGLIRFRKYHNKGAFLNAGQKRRPVVAGLSVLLTAGVAVMFAFTLGQQGNRLLKTGLSLLLGGAFSNTYDRLKRKYVVDYFSFGVRWKWLSRIVFNLSDFGIMIGAMMAALAAGQGKSKAPL